MIDSLSLLSLPMEPSRTAVARLAVDRQAHMACVDNLDFMRTLKSCSMMLIVTSPPYNIGKSYERRRSLESYVNDQAQVISECVRLLNRRGSLCWQVGNHVQDGEVFPLDVILYHVFKDHGLKLRNRIVWHFEHGLHCSKRLSGRHETIMWFTKGDDYTFNLDTIRVPSKYPNKKYFKGPKVGQLSGNPSAKTRAMYGYFQTSRIITSKRRSIPVSFRSSLSRDSCWRLPTAATVSLTLTWELGRRCWVRSSTIASDTAVTSCGNTSMSPGSGCMNYELGC